MRKSILAGVAVALLAATAASADVRPEVRFPRGATGVTLEGAVVGADRDIYRLSVRRGQTLRVRVRSAEDNAVVQVYEPGTRYDLKNGYWAFDRDGVPGAADGEDATDYTGRTARSGGYLIVVGPTRGNATYSLSISVR